MLCSMKVSTLFSFSNGFSNLLSFQCSAMNYILIFCISANDETGKI